MQTRSSDNLYHKTFFIPHFKNYYLWNYVFCVLVCTTSIWNKNLISDWSQIWFALTIVDLCVPSCAAQWLVQGFMMFTKLFFDSISTHWQIQFHRNKQSPTQKPYWGTLHPIKFYYSWCWLIKLTWQLPNTLLFTTFL